VMFADNLWGMGVLTKVEEPKILDLQQRVAPLWGDPSLLIGK